MKDFILIHRPNGGFSDDDLRQFVNRAMATDCHKIVHGATWSAIAFGDGSGADIVVPAVGRMCGIGVAALDNRQILGVPIRDGDQSDVECVVRYFNHHGSPLIENVLGAFGLVLVGNHGSQLTLCRDAFGLAPLYYRFLGNILAVSTSATVLAQQCEIDKAFIAEFLINGSNPECRTIYTAVRELPPGTVGTRHDNALHTRQFWSASTFVYNRNGEGTSSVDEFRELFGAAVQASMGDDRNAWAELSGGVDSSSVVSMAGLLAQQGRLRTGLRGTLSMVDDLGWADERRYSDAVAKAYDLPNVQVRVRWPLFDDGEPPPLTDVPNMNYVQYAGLRQLQALWRELRCTRVLSGLGSDHYLMADFTFVADLIAAGRVVGAARAAMSRAISMRRSVWQSLFRYGVFPLLPPEMRGRSREAVASIPRWLRSQFIAEYDLTARTRPVRRNGGAWRHKVEHAVAYDLVDAKQQIHPSNVFGRPAMRYPFLYRPLVERALKLHPLSRGQPYRDKLILRRALGEALPQMVRDRTGKGGTGTRITWALTQERSQVDSLLDKPLLAELGCISATRLRRQVERARRGSMLPLPALLTTLALELWLRVRMGRFVLPEKGRSSNAEAAAAL
jgi:asparagine synthase (glutamine-hydrolysing)